MVALAAVAFIVVTRPATAGIWTARSVSDLIAAINGASGAIDNWGVASISETAFTDNQAIGCIGDAGADGGFAIGGAVGNGGTLADSPECTIQNCTFRHNLAIAADGGQGKGGGYAVDAGALFGFPDTAPVTLNGGSKVNHKHPDDAFHF
jgi:hypothetical protein